LDETDDEKKRKEEIKAQFEGLCKLMKVCNCLLLFSTSLVICPDECVSIDFFAAFLSWSVLTWVFYELVLRSGQCVVVVWNDIPDWWVWWYVVT
jgi:hypothetical protein